MYSELPAITKIIPTNHFPEQSPQQEHFINTSTNPEGCHISIFMECQRIQIH